MNDSEIINKIKSGDINAFELLVDKYKSRVFRILSRSLPQQEIDEVSQMVFISVYESLGSFNAIAPFEHWLSKIAVRTCCNFWRKTKQYSKETTLDSQQLMLLDSSHSSQEYLQQADNQKKRETLNWALNQLDADSRMNVSLLYIQGYSEKEAAGLLGWSVAKVKARAFQARQSLQKSINKVFNSMVN